MGFCQVGTTEGGAETAGLGPPGTSPGVTRTGVRSAFRVRSPPHLTSLGLQDGWAQCQGDGGPLMSVSQGRGVGTWYMGAPEDTSPRSPSYACFFGLSPKVSAESTRHFWGSWAAAS